MKLWEVFGRLTQEVTANPTEEALAPALVALVDSDGDRIGDHAGCVEAGPVGEEGDKGEGASEVTEKDKDPVDGDLPEPDAPLHPGHGDDHKVGGAEVLTGEDEHDETDREEKGGNEGDEAGVVGAEGSGTALDDLDEHGSEAELPVS